MIAIQYNEDYQQPEPAKFGDLAALITKELIEICEPAKCVVIYGHAKSGKSVLTRQLSERLDNREFIFSDWFMELGFKEAMYHILNIVNQNENGKRLIVEGVQASRLLRKGVQENCFYPDVVIHIVCNYKTIEQCYIKDGEGDKLKRGMVKNFNKMLDNILEDWYYAIRWSDHKPQIIKIDTSLN